MGLDNYWLMPEENEFGDKPDSHPIFDPPLRLCGGMLSGNGCPSFRGKVYAGFVESVSGFSLYKDLSNEQVKQIAEALEGQISEESRSQFWEEDDTPETINDLRRMFRTYADHGARLVAWW